MVAAKGLLVDPRDNVITCLESCDKGGEILVLGSDEQLTAREEIPKGHKVARHSIVQGGVIIKYGVPIGIALVNIERGSLVHVHNVKSNRGKSLTTRGRRDYGEDYRLQA